MVRGLDQFRRFFAGYEDCYALIGGTACDLNFTSAALPFRATRDLDIVLCVETLTPDFFRQFWHFVAEGGYERREKSEGDRRFYRFSHPQNAGFPMLLELFSRKPDFIPDDSCGTPPTIQARGRRQTDLYDLTVMIVCGTATLLCMNQDLGLDLSKPGHTVTRGGAVVDVHHWRGRRIVWAPHPAARIKPEDWVDAVVEAAR